MPEGIKDVEGLIARDPSLSFDAGIAYETVSNVSADHREAVDAFRNKRTPKFTGPTVCLYCTALLKKIPTSLLVLRSPPAALAVVNN